jgi:hypothetical protein
MNELKIKIVSKEEFTEIFLKCLVNDREGWSTEDIFRFLLGTGFPKIDFDRLNDCLNKTTVYLPTVAVDIGDSLFVWVVAGNKAILVEKN